MDNVAVGGKGEPSMSQHGPVDDDAGLANNLSC